MSSIQLGFNPATCGVQPYNYTPPTTDVLYASPSGVSTNAGTLASPLNIAAAVAQIPAGGTIVLRGGTYRNVGNYNHGTKSFSVIAYQNEAPVLDGSTPFTTAWTVEGAAWKTPFTFTHVPYIFQYAEQHYDAAAQFMKNFHQVFVDGVPLIQVGAKTQVTATTFWVDAANGQVYIGVNPAGKEIAYSTRMYFLLAGNNNTTPANAPNFKGLTLRNYAEGALRIGFHNSVVENCRIENAGKYGIQIQASNVVVRFSRISHIGMLALTCGQCTGVRFENLQILDPMVYAYRKGWHCGGIKIVGNAAATSWSSDFASRNFGVNFVVNNCDISRDPKWGTYEYNGVWFDVLATKSRVLNCRIKNFLNGIFNECSQLNAFWGNLFLDCNIGINIYHSQDSLILNNTFVDSAYAIQVADTGRREPTQSVHDHPALKPNYVTRNAKIYNNLMIGSRYADDTSRAITTRVYGTDDPNLYVTEAKNNVFVRRNRLVNGVNKAIPVNVWTHKNGATNQFLFQTLSSLRQVYSYLEAGSFVISPSETVLDSSYVPTNTKIINAGFPLNAEQAGWLSLPTGTVTDIGAFQSSQTNTPPPVVDPEPDPPTTDPCSLQNAEIANLTATRDAQAAEIAGLTADNQALAATVSANEAIIALRDADIVSLQTQIASLNAQIAALQSQLTAAQALAQDRLVSLNAVQATVSTKDTEIQNLISVGAAKDAQITTLQNSVAAKDAQIEVLSASLNNTSVSFNGQTMQIQALVEERNTLSTQLEAKQTELRALLDWDNLTDVVTTLLNEKGITVNSLQITIN